MLGGSILLLEGAIHACSELRVSLLVASGERMLRRRVALLVIVQAGDIFLRILFSLKHSKNFNPSFYCRFLVFQLFDQDFLKNVIPCVFLLVCLEAF